MSKVLVTDTYLTDIGRAIRYKNGTGETYKPSEMGDAIANIITEPELENLRVIPTDSSQNFQSQEYYGYDMVKVEAIPSEYIVPTGELEITESGSYDVTSYASANVNVAGGGSVQVEIQRYTPTDSESSHTFKHNLGVMPDFVFIYRNGNSTNHNNYIIEYGIGWKAKTSSDEDVPQGSHALYSKGYSMSKYAQLSWEYGLEDKIGMGNPINADTENIYLQADKYYSSTMLSGAEYILIAIAGVR